MKARKLKLWLLSQSLRKTKGTSKDQSRRIKILKQHSIFRSAFSIQKIMSFFKLFCANEFTYVGY